MTQFGNTSGGDGNSFPGGNTTYETWIRTGELDANPQVIFETGGTGGSNHNPWPEVKGGPKLAYGTWGKGVARAAKEFDVWIASGMHRTPDEVCAVAPEYRAAGGQRAIVTTINVSGDTDLGQLKADLDQYAAAGFDDAVILPLPGIPPLDQIRKLVD